MSVTQWNAAPVTDSSGTLLTDNLGVFLRNKLIIWKNIVTNVFSQITELNIDPNHLDHVYTIVPPNQPAEMTNFGIHNQEVGVAVYNYQTLTPRSIDEYRQVVETYDRVRLGLGDTTDKLIDAMVGQLTKLTESLKESNTTFGGQDTKTVHTALADLNVRDRTILITSVFPNSASELDKYLVGLLTDTASKPMTMALPDIFAGYMMASFFRKPGVQPVFDSSATSLTMWSIENSVLKPVDIKMDKDPKLTPLGVLIVNATGSSSAPVFGSGSKGAAYIQYDGKPNGQVVTQAQELQSLYVETLKLLADTNQISALGDDDIYKNFPMAQPIDKLRTLITGDIQSGPFKNYLALWHELQSTGQGLSNIVRSSTLKPSIVKNPANLQTQREKTHKRINLIVGALLDIRSNFGAARSDGTGFADEDFQNLHVPIWLLWEAVRLFGDGSTQSRAVIGSVMLGLLILRSESFFQYEVGDVVVDIVTNKLYRITNATFLDVSGVEITTSERTTNETTTQIIETNPTPEPTVKLKYPQIRLFRDSSKDTQVVPEFGLSKTDFDGRVRDFTSRGFMMDEDKAGGHLKLQMDTTATSVDADWKLWPQTDDADQRKKYIQGELMDRIIQALHAGEAFGAMTQLIMISLTYALYISTQTTQPRLLQGGSSLTQFQGGDFVKDVLDRIQPLSNTLAKMAGVNSKLGQFLYREDVTSHAYDIFLYNALDAAFRHSKQLDAKVLGTHMPTVEDSMPKEASAIWSFINQRAAPENNDLAMIPTLFAKFKPLRDVWTAPSDLKGRPGHEVFKGALMYSVFYLPTRNVQQITEQTDIDSRVKDLYMRQVVNNIMSNAKTIDGMLQQFVPLDNPHQTRVEETNEAQYRILLKAVVDDEKNGTVDANSNLDALTGSMTGPQFVGFLEWLSKGRLLLNLRQPDAMYEPVTHEYFGSNYALGPSQAVQYMYRAAMRILCAFLGLNHNIASDSIALNLTRQNALEVVRKLMSLNLVPVTIDYEGLIAQVAQDEHAQNQQNVWEHLFMWQASLSRKRALTDFSNLYVLICRAIQYIVATYLDTVVKVGSGYEVVLVSVQTPSTTRSMFQGGGNKDSFQGGNWFTALFRPNISFDTMVKEFGTHLSVVETAWNTYTPENKESAINVLIEAFNKLVEKGDKEPPQFTDTSVYNKFKSRLTVLYQTRTDPIQPAPFIEPAATGTSVPPPTTVVVPAVPTSAPAATGSSALDQLVQALAGAPISAPAPGTVGNLTLPPSAPAAATVTSSTVTAVTRPSRTDEYSIDFYTISASIPNDRALDMLKSVAIFKRDVIAHQVKSHQLTKPQSQVVTPSAITWLLQLTDTIAQELYNRTTLSQLDQLDIFKDLNVQRPGVMGIDGVLHYLCAYNFSVNINAIPASNMGAKLSSKLPVIDCFAYPDFWVNPSALKPLLESYKDNVMTQDDASSDQLHKYLNAVLMHTCPDNLPLIFRTDVARIIKSNQATRKPLIKRVLEALTKKPGIRLEVHLDPTFEKELRDAQRKSSALFQPNGSQYVVGTNGKPISLTRATRMLMGRVMRTAIAGSYAEVDMPMSVQSGKFAGGARHAGIQPAMIASQLEPFTKANFVDVDSSVNGQGRLLSLKLYQLFAEVVELIPDLDSETLLYFLPDYRIGKYGQAKNADKKKLLGGQYVNLRAQRGTIDAISQIAGLATLMDTSPLIQGIADSHPEQVEESKLLQAKQEKEAVSTNMDALVVQRLADEQTKVDNPANEKERRTAEARIDALKKGQAKLFRSKLVEVPPAYGFQKWQQTLAGWTDKAGLHWFRRSCHKKGFLGVKSYCMWEPNDRVEEKKNETNKVDSTVKANTAPKLGVPNQPVKLPPSVQMSAAASKATNARLQAAAANDAVVNRVLREQSQLATATHEKIIRDRPQEVMDGNRGTGAVRVFTARDAAGNEVFTVLPHNLIANLMILVYAALIIYAGSQGARAYQTLYAVQIDDATTKLEAVYPARGAATFFYGFGFGTIVAFLASIVEFFNYWRFRYVFGLVLMSVPIIVLGAVGISSLDAENSILSKLVNAEDASGVDESGVDTSETNPSETDPSDTSISTSTSPSFWSSLLGTTYTDAVTDARESLAISDMLFIGLGVGVLTAGIMIGIPGGPFHTDRNEAVIHKMRDGAKGETAQRSQVKTHWIIYPILLTVAVIGAGSATIGVATEGGPQIKRTEASVDENEAGDYTSVQDNVAWPQIQGAIVAMVISVLLLGGLVLIGYIRQRHALTVGAGNQVAKGIEATKARPAANAYSRGAQPARTFTKNIAGLPQGAR
jgi:hypothetical protein